MGEFIDAEMRRRGGEGCRSGGGDKGKRSGEDKDKLNISHPRDCSFNAWGAERNSLN